MSPETSANAVWVDLVDPTDSEITERFGREIHPRAMEWLATPTEPSRHGRPKLETYGDYVVGLLIVANPVGDEDRVFYQEVGLLLARDVAVVRKAPHTKSRTDEPDAPFEPVDLRKACAEGERLPAGKIGFWVLKQVAEHYVDVVEALQEEITEAEGGVEELPAEDVRKRLSELRSDVLNIRRTLVPTRDAVRRIMDERLDTEGDEIFSEDVEFELRDVYDSLLRAIDGLDAAREMLVSVRDYLQAKVANDQSDVMKRLTVLASLLLLPTLVVGFYGQNFENVPELHWGVWWSWVLIGVTTVGQLVFFKKRGWF